MNSPGKIEFIGVGEVIKQISDFIFRIINVRKEVESLKINNEIEKETLIKQRIENMEKILEMCKKHNLDYELTKQLIDKEYIANNNLTKVINANIISKIQLSEIE